MKILWVTNTIFPDLAKSLKLNIPVVGGWMYSLAKDLSKVDNIELTVVTAQKLKTDYNTKINGINYSILKSSKVNIFYDKELEKKWSLLINNNKPDIVHIHGTEYAHGLALMLSCPKLNYVISIQGLISVYTRYYFGGIPLIDIYKNLTFRDLIKRDSIIKGKKEFLKRGNLIEKKYIKLSKNFIGRTEWDKDHVKTINPDSQYHFCNESLRSEFYESRKWDINTIEKHTIFLSQAGRPLKGLHKVLEAVFLLKKDFPNISIRIAGGNIIESNSLKSKLKLKGYGKYIKSIIKKFDLLDQITFTGPLNENEMVNEYLNSNIFICPSSIENSPNSLGEAQLLGVPTIAAYVGGVSNMVNHMETGIMYRFEEVEMLAQAIKSILLSPHLSIKLSKQGIIAAEKRHNTEENLNQLLNIYNKIKQ